ncbi:NUDIX domain-containing protein [Alcaligenes ammonioxydans]|uniref:NUDIX hydrolase n=1 Tax=Alcaligenes TaxID=507 RepID=UPI001F064711|nr:NUDIX domain-containing protein [Alcaligenes ammonioxydans]MCH1878900.1 NUDIX domain-containing protein [Alcaligenes ammonioxydans]
MSPPVILLAAAYITNPAGQILLVRKRGSTYYMQAGGKLEAGETPLQALQRELEEELGLTAQETAQARYEAYFESPAANEPGHMVHAHVFTLSVERDIQAAAELEEARWVSPQEIRSLTLAPLLANHILPRLCAPASA